MESVKMYLWLCVCAIVGWFCCSSELGLFFIQAGCCALGLLVCPAGGHVSTQCSEPAAQQKSETGHMVGSDEPDTAVQTVQKASYQQQYPNVLRSLHQMFKCAYTHLVLPWCAAPELGDSQPLHTALLTEFNFVVDKIICKVKDLDLSVTGLGCIQIVTQHLRHAKQSDGSQSFSSNTEEIAVLRGFCKALIHNLFPKHLWEPDVYCCALQEILTTKALVLVTLLSDPDNLNRLILCQLNQAPSENSMEEAHDSDREDTPSSMWSKNMDEVQDKAEECPSEQEKAKKKGQKIKEKLFKVFDSIKLKKAKLKRKEKEVRQGALPSRKAAVMDDASSSEGFICDSVDTDGEDHTSCLQEEMMEFKLSYEMWRVGNWTVNVTNVLMEEEELCFTVHLEESNNPENLHWDVKKTQTDIINFYSHCKEMGHLPFVLTIVENPRTEWNEEEAKETLEHFLQELVANPELGHTPLLFKFLGPIDWILNEKAHDDGVWVLLGGIASFLTPGQDDDELSNLKWEEKQVMYERSTSEATPQHELDAAQPMCMDTLERRFKETEDELLATDDGYSFTLEQTSACTSEKQDTDYTDHLFIQPDVNPSGTESVGENVAHFTAGTKYLKSGQNPKRQSADLSSCESYDSLGHYTTDGVPDCCYIGNVSKKENLPHKKSLETDEPERKEKESHPEEETWSQPLVGTKISNPGQQPEANKVIFDLLKEISGNSYTLKFLKAVLKPFMPLVKKKLNAFLKTLNPSEVQIAAYIDSLCENIWPDRPVPQPPPRSSDEKNETKEKAMQLMSSKFAGLAILNKTNVENTFKIFQNAGENKKLVCLLLSYLQEEFLP